MSTPVGHAHQFFKLTQAPDHSCVELIRKRGIDVLNDSALNKVHRLRCVFRAATSRKRGRRLSLQGTGFSLAERERLGLRGLLPPRVLSADSQVTCAHKLRCGQMMRICCKTLCICHRLPESWRTTIPARTF